MPNRWIICGGNGAGKSTLGKALSLYLGWEYRDIEDYYFPKKDSDYVYETQRTREAVRELLLEDSPLWYLISREQTQRLLDAEMPSPWYGQLMRRPQTMAYLLQLEFWLRYYRVEFVF